MLRGAALRVTRPRVAVLSAVHDHPHADTDSIIGVVREDLGEVSHQAVYDVLRALTAAGLVRRIQPSGSVARYEARVGDNHHHVVCRSCGAIADVDCAVGYAPCLTAADDRGLRDRRGRGHLLGPVSRVCRGNVLPGPAADRRPALDTSEQRSLGSRATTSRTASSRTARQERTDVSDHGSESENPVIPSPTPEAAVGPGRTGTGGRTSWTCRFSTSTRPGPTRWARTSTTRRSSRPSTSTR